MSHEKKHTTHKRTTFILDREWQLAAFRNMAGVALCAGVVQSLLLYSISSLDPVERWSGEQIGYAALAANTAYIGLVFFAIWVVAIRLTHSVVGPAMVIRRAVQGMTDGDYDHRLTLREKDYLKDLAASVQDLPHELEARDELARQLSAALHAGDSDRALSLANRLDRQAEPSSSEESQCAA